MAKRKQKHIIKQEQQLIEKSTVRRCSADHKSHSTDDEEGATLLDQPTKKLRASAGKCDDESKEAVKNFNHEEYNNFFKSFNSEVAKSVGGTMGELYRATYRGVVRVTVVDFNQQTKSQGNAFVICKKKRVSILLTCAHIFGDSVFSKSIYVVSSDFKCFKATVWHISKDMDICMLKVRDDLGSNVVELNTWCDEINFMEDIFSISCPRYKMNVGKSLFPPSNVEKDLANTLWFTVIKGYVSHPFLVGFHPRNLDGIFLQMHGGNWGEGSSGAPILNMKGEAIGMYVGSSSASDALNVKHWALRLNSVRDYLEKIFEVPEKRKGRNSLKNMIWSCLKDIRAKRGVIDWGKGSLQRTWSEQVRKPRVVWLRHKKGGRVPKMEERPFKRGRTLGMNNKCCQFRGSLHQTWSE